MLSVLFPRVCLSRSNFFFPLPADTIFFSFSLAFCFASRGGRGREFPESEHVDKLGVSTPPATVVAVWSKSANEVVLECFFEGWLLPPPVSLEASGDIFRF